MLKPGDVVLADFPGARGIKRRPCVVISTELYHANRPDVMLTVVTTNIAAATSPTDYVLQDYLQAGLHQPSAVRVYISARLQRQVLKTGRLSDEDWAEVKKRLGIGVD